MANPALDRQATEPTVVLHYGDHAGTTGVHFATAAAMSTSAPYSIESCPQAAHLLISSRRNVRGYIWVESGIASYPLDTHVAPFATCGYLIDVHRHLGTSLLQAALFDVVFVAQKDYVERVREVNSSAQWLPLAAPDSFVAGEREPRFDVGFVGQARRGTRREAVLRAINIKYGMNDWRRPYTVDEMSQVYLGSRVVVNDPINGDVNMRFFEAMGCGACVVSPALNNGVEELAEQGRHYLVADFDDVDSVIESVASVLRSGQADELGRRARALVADRHTYSQRLKVLEHALATAPLNAPVRSMSNRERARHLARLAESIADEGLARSALRVGGVADVRAAYQVVRAFARAKRRKTILRTPLLAL